MRCGTVEQGAKKIEIFNVIELKAYLPTIPTLAVDLIDFAFVPVRALPVDTRMAKTNDGV